jgi:membrane-associated protein
LFDRPKSRLFNPANVTKAHGFFERYGSKTIVLARFVPVVRTFAPIVAGVATMRYRTFLIYNIIGGVLWGAGITTLGYFLGQVGWVKDNIEVAIVAIIAVSLLPVTIEFLRHRRNARRAVPAD